MRGEISAHTLASCGQIPDAANMLRRLLCSWMLACAPLFAGTAQEDWARVTALDAGPGVVPKNTGEALSAALGHLARQEKALRDFLAAHPADANAFEAHLRLARLLTLRADIKGEAASAEIHTLLQGAEKYATTPARRTVLDFDLLTGHMRKWRAKRPPADERSGLLEEVQSFRKAHPEDRRIAGLLAEVATLYDGEPNTKESLLLNAKKLAQEPELKAQIADDLKRLGFFGKPLPLRFTALDGRRVDAKDWRGKVVALVFFATASEPSKIGFMDLQRVVEKTGGNALLVAVSLDTGRDALETFLRQQNATCPVAWDSKGWDGPLIRALGINALPTAWLLDQRGVVRTLDALDEPAAQIRRLLDAE